MESLSLLGKSAASAYVYICVPWRNWSRKIMISSNWIWKEIFEWNGTHPHFDNCSGEMKLSKSSGNSMIGAEMRKTTKTIFSRTNCEIKKQTSVWQRYVKMFKAQLFVDEVYQHPHWLLHLNLESSEARFLPLLCCVTTFQLQQKKSILLYANFYRLFRKSRIAEDNAIWCFYRALRRSTDCNI